MLGRRKEREEEGEGEGEQQGGNCLSAPGSEAGRRRRGRGEERDGGGKDGRQEEIHWDHQAGDDLAGGAAEKAGGVGGAVEAGGADERQEERGRVSCHLETRGKGTLQERVWHGEVLIVQSPHLKSHMTYNAVKECDGCCACYETMFCILFI